jgi:hypothetical protein
VAAPYKGAWSRSYSDSQGCRRAASLGKVQPQAGKDAETLSEAEAHGLGIRGQEELARGLNEANLQEIVSMRNSAEQKEAYHYELRVELLS